MILKTEPKQLASLPGLPGRIASRKQKSFEKVLKYQKHTKIIKNQTRGEDSTIYTEQQLTRLRTLVHEMRNEAFQRNFGPLLLQEKIQDNPTPSGTESISENETIPAAWAVQQLDYLESRLRLWSACSMGPLPSLLTTSSLHRWFSIPR